MKSITKLMKKYKTAAMLISVTLLLALCTLGILAFYEDKTSEKIQEQTYNILQDSAWQQADIVISLIEERFRVLDTAALRASESNLDNVNALWTELKPLLNRMRFTRLCAVAPDGHTYTSDGIQVNLSQRPYFKSAMAGKRQLEYIKDPIFGDKALFLFMVPVYRDGKILGVIMGECPTLLFSSAMVSRAFNSGTYSFLCTRDMQIIVTSAHHSYLGETGSLWHLLNGSALLKESSLETTEKDFKMGSPGWIAYSLDGNDRFMAYHPLGINDWMICNVVPENLLNTSTEAFSSFGRQIGGLLSAMALIFIVIIVWTDHKQQKLLKDEHARLVESEERSRIAMENSSVSFWDYDIATKRIIQTEHAIEQHGIGPIIENVPESMIEEGYIHPDSVDTYNELYQKICEGEKFPKAVVKVRRKDGTGWWYESISYTVLFDENGKPYKAIGMGSDVSESELKERELMDAAQRDSLTGLLNHEATLAAVRRWLREGLHSEGALFALDIDKFKHLNDTLGHQAGDTILKEAAQKITNNFRTGDVVGRVGGDEFVVLMRGGSRDAVRKKADMLIKALRMSCVGDEAMVDLTASVGISFQRSGDTLESLYGRADAALYKAKEEGRDRWIAEEE